MHLPGMEPHCKLILILLFLSVNHLLTTSTSNQDRSQELSELKTTLENYKKEIEVLNVKGEKMKKKITKTKLNCDKEVQELNQQHEEKMKKSEESQKILYSLLHKFKEEEETHKKLQQELAKLSDVMGLIQFQHAVMNLELQLAQGRRENGTMAQCKQITIQLTVDNQENSLLSRANLNPYKMRKYSRTSQDREVMVLDSKVSLLRLMRDKVIKATEQSEKLFQMEIQNCHEKISNLKNLMEDTNHMLKVQTSSIEVLNKDLREAVAFSKSVRLEIETGKQLITELKKVLNKARQESKEYKSDLKCFENIKKID